MTRLTDERIAEIEAKLSSYDFKDSLGHPLTNCKDFQYLLAEMKVLKAEKAQAEAERDALAAELKENWPFLSGVMYAAAEMVMNGMDTTVPLDILIASGHWDEFEAHCNSYDVERFRQAVGEKCVNRLRQAERKERNDEEGKGGAI